MNNPFSKLNKDSISDFLEENKKLILIICSTFIFFMLILLIALSPKKKTEKEIDNPPMSEVVLPDEPSLNEGYKLSREINESWSEEEINKYFMDMDDGLKEQLRKHNSSKIQKVLGDVH
jgi:hypothetical protein